MARRQTSLKRNATASSSKLAPAPANSDYEEEPKLPSPPPPPVRAANRQSTGGTLKRKRVSTPVKGKSNGKDKDRGEESYESISSEESDHEEERNMAGPQAKRRKVEVKRGSTVKQQEGSKGGNRETTVQPRTSSSAAGRPQGVASRKKRAVRPAPAEEEEESPSHSEGHVFPRKEEQESSSSADEGKHAAPLSPRGVSPSPSRYSSSPPRPHVKKTLEQKRLDRLSAKQKNKRVSPPPRVRQSSPAPPTRPTTTKQTTNGKDKAASLTLQKKASSSSTIAQPQGAPKSSPRPVEHPPPQPIKVGRVWSPAGSDESDTNIINKPITRGKARADKGAQTFINARSVAKSIPQPPRTKSKTAASGAKSESDNDDEVQVVEIRDSLEGKTPRRASSKRSLGEASALSTPSHRASTSKASPSRQPDRDAAARADDEHDRGPTPPSIAAGLSYPHINFVTDIDMYDTPENEAYTQAPANGQEQEQQNGVDELHGSSPPSPVVRMREKSKGKDTDAAPLPKARATLPNRRPVGITRTASGRHPSSRFVDDTIGDESLQPPSSQDQNGEEHSEEIIQIATQTQDRSPPPPPVHSRRKSRSKSPIRQKPLRSIPNEISLSVFAPCNEPLSIASQKLPFSSQIDQFSTPAARKKKGSSQEEIEDADEEDDIVSQFDEEEAVGEDAVGDPDEVMVPMPAQQSKTSPSQGSWGGLVTKTFRSVIKGLAPQAVEEKRQVASDRHLERPEPNGYQAQKGDVKQGSVAAKRLGDSQESANKGESQDSAGAVKGDSPQQQWGSSADIEPNGGLEKLERLPVQVVDDDETDEDEDVGYDEEDAQAHRKEKDAEVADDEADAEGEEDNEVCSCACRHQCLLLTLVLAGLVRKRHRYEVNARPECRFVFSRQSYQGLHSTRSSTITRL